MGWRFRKSKSFGIFRTTLSKKGVGTSIGIPGLRFGISPDGRKYYSFGFPGTGFFYIKYLKKQEKKQQTQTTNQLQTAENQVNSSVDINEISKKF
jgi:hypothetical protein